MVPSLDTFTNKVEKARYNLRKSSLAVICITSIVFGLNLNTSFMSSQLKCQGESLLLYILFFLLQSKSEILSSVAKSKYFHRAQTV